MAGVGEPLPWAMNVTGLPAVAVWLVGDVRTAGTDPATVRVAGFVAALLPALVKTASYWLPLSAGSASRVKAAVVALGLPRRGWKFVLPLAAISHCTAGAGKPRAAAVNVTVSPLPTVWLLGYVTTTAGIYPARGNSLIALPSTK